MKNRILTSLLMLAMLGSMPMPTMAEEDTTSEATNTSEHKSQNKTEPEMPFTNTTGKWAIGGRSAVSAIATLSGFVGLASASGSASASSLATASANVAASFYNTNLLSFRYGLTDSLNISGLLGLRVMNLSFSSPTVSLTSPSVTTSSSSMNLTSLVLGTELEFIMAKTDRMRCFAAGAVVLNGLGGIGATSGGTTTNVPTPPLLEVTPSLGVEYFLTRNLSLEGGVGFPIVFAFGGSAGSAMFANLDFRPVLGGHYYF